jgi:hypothetical protein
VTVLLDSFKKFHGCLFVREIGRDSLERDQSDSLSAAKLGAISHHNDILTYK